MSLPVRARARSLATFRYLEVRLMETLARWVPTTPEMEAKILFGQHIWDHAQHADALGRRTHELRAPLHHTLEPAAAWLDLFAEMDRITVTAERLHALYGIVLPRLESLYQAYLAATDVLLDAPSVRAVTGILLDLSRMKSEQRALIDQVPALASAESACPRLSGLAASAGDPVVPEPAGGGAARPEGAVTGGTLPPAAQRLRS